MLALKVPYIYAESISEYFLRYSSIISGVKSANAMSPPLEKNKLGIILTLYWNSPQINQSPATHIFIGGSIVEQICIDSLILEIKKYCQTDSKSQELLKKYVDAGKLSARGYHRILKVARTIADLANQQHINHNHIAEALMYRLKN